MLTIIKRERYVTNGDNRMCRGNAKISTMISSSDYSIDRTHLPSSLCRVFFSCFRTNDLSRFIPLSRGWYRCEMWLRLFLFRRDRGWHDGEREKGKVFFLSFAQCIPLASLSHMFRFFFSSHISKFQLHVDVVAPSLFRFQCAKKLARLNSRRMRIEANRCDVEGNETFSKYWSIDLFISPSTSPPRVSPWRRLTKIVVAMRTFLFFS